MHGLYPIADQNVGLDIAGKLCHAARMGQALRKTVYSGRPKIGWRGQEREFRAQRDPKQRVTLPRLKCLEQDESQGSERLRLDECES